MRTAHRIVANLGLALLGIIAVFGHPPSASGALRLLETSSPSARIFVAQQIENTVYAYTLVAPHRLLSKLAVAQPFDLAADAHGNLYVASYGPSGPAVAVYWAGSTVPHSYAGLIAPLALAVGPGGILYVMDRQQGIVEFLPGHMTPSTVLNVDHIGQFTVDAARNVYVVANVCLDPYCVYQAGTVFAYAPGKTTGKDLNFESSLASAAGVAIDPKGDVDVADPQVGVVDVLSPRTGRLVNQINQDLQRPEQLVFDSAGRTLYVDDGGTGAVSAFDYAHGTRIGTVGNCFAAVQCTGIAVFPPAP